MKKPKKIPKVKKKKKVIPAHLPIKTHPNFTTPGIRSAVSNNQLSLHIIDTDCGTEYIRNNKRGGLKNLRCFPKCLTKGHNRNGKKFIKRMERASRIWKHCSYRRSDLY